MKIILRIILAFAVLTRLSAQSLPPPVVQTVTADLNGKLAAPTNFFRASSNELSQVVNDTLQIDARLSTPGFIQATGLTISVGSVTLSDDAGRMISFPGGSIILPANATVYVGFDMYNRTLHYHRRAIDSGMVWLAQVTTGASSVTSTTRPHQILLPESGVERTKQRLRVGQSIRVSIVGDSLSWYVAAGHTGWWQSLFNTGANGGTYNVPSVTKVTWNNYAVPSSNPAYGMAVCGRARGGPGSSTLDNSFASTVRGPYYGQFTSFQFAGYENPFEESPVLQQGTDLLILAYYNYGFYKLGYIEQIVRQARDRGIEVLLVAPGPNSTDQTWLETEGPALQAIAQAYGCSLVDVNQWMREFVEAGYGAPYQDTVHQNQAGHDVWARAILSSLNTYTLTPAATHGSVRPVVGTSSSAETARFPTQSDVIFTPNRHDGTIGGITAGSLGESQNLNPALLFGGKNTANSALLLAPGQSAIVGHPMALAIDVLFEVKPGESYTYQMRRSGVTLRTVTTPTWPASGVAPQIQLYETMNISDMLAQANDGYSGGAQLFGNGVLGLYNTGSTTIRLIGFVVHTVPWNEVPYSAWDRVTGTWPRENALWSAQSIYSDTVNDTINYTFTGRGIVFSIYGGPMAGIIQVQLDGKPIGTRDLYVASDGIWTQSLFPDFASSGTIHTAPRQHTLTLKINGVNGSATAPAAARRRCGIQQAYVVP